jgi:hypothetical protein
MTEVQACLMILGFMILLLAVNLVLALAMIKIYTEMFKELRHHKREMSR